MGNGVDNFALKCLAVAVAILVVRLGWMAISLYGGIIGLAVVVSAVLVVVTALVVALAFCVKPEATAARIRQVIAAARSIFG